VKRAATTIVRNVDDCVCVGVAPVSDQIVAAEPFDARRLVPSTSCTRIPPFHVRSVVNVIPEGTSLFSVITPVASANHARSPDRTVLDVALVRYAAIGYGGASEPIS
jgi:hypothetical protein